MAMLKLEKINSGYGAIQALHDAGFQAIEPARSRSIRVSWRNI